MPERLGLAGGVSTHGGRERFTRAVLGDWLFAGYRLLWWGGFVLMLVINFYAAPVSEWADRDRVVAAARLGLGIVSSSDPTGVVVAPLGEAGRATGVREGDVLVAVDGRPLPASSEAGPSLSLLAIFAGGENVVQTIGQAYSAAVSAHSPAVSARRSRRR